MPKPGHILSTLKHASIYSFSSILGKAIGFIMLPIYAHYLRGEGYGIIGMIETVLSVLTLLIGYGITGAMSRFYYEKTDEDERKTVVSTVIILMFLMVVLVSSPVLMFSRPVAYLVFGEADYSPYILLAVLAFMAEMTSKNAQAYILIRQQSVFFSILAILRLVISLGLNILFIVKMELGVYGFLYSSLIVSVLFTVIMHVNALARVGLRFDPGIARHVFAFSLPLLPGYVAMFIRGNADRYILRTSLGLAQVGVFEMVFKFATLIGFLVGEPFMRTWGMKQLEICEKDEGPQTMADIFNIHFSLMLFAGLLLSLEIPLLLRVLTPPEFWVGGAIALLAVLSRVFGVVYYHFYFGLLYAKSTMQISGIQATSAAVSVLLNLLLIPRFGILGAVITSCVAVSCQCLLALKSARKHYFIPYRWKKIGFLFVSFLGLYFLYEPLTVASVGLRPFFDQHITPVAREALYFLQLDAFRGGKYLDKVLGNLELIAEIGMKFIFSLTFLLAMLVTGVIPVRVLAWRPDWLNRTRLRSMGKSG